jgi:zinc protease
MRHYVRRFVLGFGILVLASPLAEARNVQTLRTPTGIGLWLVEDHGLPLVALRFAMRGGSLEDPPGREGAGDLFAAMLDQGAGPLDAAAYQDRLQAVGSRLSFSVSRAAFSGGFVSVSSHLAATAGLLRLALTEPRLSVVDFERVRGQAIAATAQDERSPDRLALRLFYDAAFAGHAYARPVRGTGETLARLTVADMAAQRLKILGRSGLHVVIVGALGAQEARALVDGMFADLPKGGTPPAVTRAEPAPITAVLRAPEGQPLETAIFALPMPRMGEPGYFPALALNHILGSGNFDARLTRELRVKRGLTYAIATHMFSDAVASFLLGTVSVAPGRMEEALDTVKQTLATLQRGGPDERELENAKSSLNGSYLLGADGNARLADHLLGLWLTGHGARHDEQRRAEIDAINLDDARQAARAYFDPGAMRQLILRPAGGD